MIKAINQWAFPKGTKAIDCVRLARESGFLAIELVVDEVGEISLASTGREIEGLAAAVRGEGLPVCSVASGLLWRNNLIDPDPAIRERAMGIGRRCIEIAAALGANTVLVIPGIVTEAVHYRDAYQMAMGQLRALGDIGARYGIGIGMENGGNKFLITPMEFRRFLDEMDHPYVGAYLDVANAMLDGFPTHWIRELGNKRIRQIHFKDYVGGGIGGPSRPYSHLMEGIVDWPGVLAELRRIDYRGYVVAEVTPFKHFPREGISTVSTAMDRLIAVPA